MAEQTTIGEKEEWDLVTKPVPDNQRVPAVEFNELNDKYNASVYEINANNAHRSAPHAPVDAPSASAFAAALDTVNSSITSEAQSRQSADIQASRALVSIDGTYRSFNTPIDFYEPGFYSDDFYTPAVKEDEKTPNSVVLSGDSDDTLGLLISGVINKQDGFDTSIRVVESDTKVAQSRAMIAQHGVNMERSENELQSISMAFSFEYMAEILRFMGGSGIVGSRQYTLSSFHSPSQRVFDTTYSALNSHNHPDYAAMSGIAEQVAIVNGYFVRTRHLDYKFYSPIQGPTDEINVEPVLAPPVPASVLAKPTGVNLTTGAVDKTSDTQARWMSRVFEDNPEECKVYLSGMQVWLERTDGGVPDNVDSFRHENIFDSALDEFNEGTYLSHSGHKNRLENLNFQSNTIAIIDNKGDPVLVRVAYAMTTQYMGTMAPRTQTHVIAPLIAIGYNQHGHMLSSQLTDEQAQDLVDGVITEVNLVSDDGGHHHDYRITWNGSGFVGVDLNGDHQHEVLIEENYDGRIPFDFSKARSGVIDDTNRYTLVRDELTIAREGSLQSADGSRLLRFKCADIERMCERVWGLDGEGAFIQEQYDQYGLVDDLQDKDGGALNSAIYNRRYSLLNADASGRAAADRGFNDPNLFVASTSNQNILSGKSWFIPIEVVVLTPLNSWNPYNLPTRSDETVPVGAGTESTPFQERAVKEAYGGIPYAFWSDSATGDPADTTEHMWIMDSTSTPRHVWAQGMRIHLPTGERTRIPVYENFFETSYESVQQANRNNRLKDILKRIVQSQFYGTVSESEIDEL